ncbi:MAG: SRPBCC family protein [Gemmatimonadota bacterium]|nr:MAG: SRPBCC family protein [Gemmatimonadota bacterium]
MAIEIQKSFEINRPVEDVWEFLTTPERVVECLPAAQLTERVDDRNFRGEMGVRLGPIGVTFQGTIQFVTLDVENHEVTMHGEGKDARGSGSVKMEMHSKLTALEGGGTHVDVSQTVNLAGRLASFGRGGIIQNVADFMFGRFTDCVKGKLEG